MNLPRSIFLIVITLVSLSPALESAHLLREGRKIQLDGFLIDWVEKNRLPWNGSAPWSWDAVNTPEGVAGYFHAAGSVPCSSWVFVADAGRHGPLEMHVPEVNKGEDPLYRVNRNQPQDHKVSVTIEWLLPWDSIAIDDSGTYQITIGGKNSCGDSLEPILLTGKKESAPSPLPSRFNERLGIIIALIAIFIALQIRIRKKTLRKGSPRRSA